MQWIWSKLLTMLSTILQKCNYSHSEVILARPRGKRFSLTVSSIDNRLSQSCVDMLLIHFWSEKLDHRMLMCYREYSLFFPGVFFSSGSKRWLKEGKVKNLRQRRKQKDKIRSRNSTINRDWGTYLLSHLFDPLLKSTPGRKVNTPGNTSTSGDQVSRSLSGSITSTQLWESRLSIDETVSEKNKFSSWSCQNNF